MSMVNVNTASEWQLEILLGLSAEEVAAIVAARPIADIDKLRNVLPERCRRTASLQISKLDVNAISVNELVQRTKVSLDVARAVVAHRPYFAIAQLRRIPELVAALPNYGDVLDIHDFVYQDKLTGS